MKKLLSAILALTLMLSLAACGGGNDQSKEAPDLQKFYDEYMTGLGENAPAMMSLKDDPAYMESCFPGLADYELKQSILQAAMISAVAYEMDLVECANADDVEAVKGIFQSRIDSQLSGGVLYPATVAAWEAAEIIVNGNVVALIVANEQQADAVSAFNALFA